MIKLVHNLPGFAFKHSPIQVFNRFKAEVHRHSPVVSYSACSLSIDVTTACNLECPWCSTKQYRNANPPQHLSLSRARELLSKFKTATFVGFCGAGETFLNPDLFAMARYADQLNIKVLITTNGSLLFKRMNELLSSNVNTLEVSLKGISIEDYQLVDSNKESIFSSILAAVRNLSKSHGRPRLVMSYVCDRNSVHNIPSLVSIASECGVDELLLYNLIPHPEIKNESLCLFEDDTEWVLSILNRSLKNSRIIPVNGPGFYSRNSLSRKCRMPFKSLRVGLDGGVSGCPRAINPSLENGNALFDNDVFNSEHFRKLRFEHIHSTMPLRYECMYCDQRC